MDKLKFLWGALIVFALLITACTDDNDPVNPVAQKEYLVSAKLLKSYTTNEAKAFYGVLQTQYPDVAQLATQIKTGIDVYKIVYKTELKDKTLNASALVAVPNTAGQYPIVSFQNGTNPLHANAPTVNLTNPLYQALSLTATTGFVVAFPDYIGFGESDDIIPHPYFHKESTVETVVDMLKAIREMKSELKNPVDITKDLFLAGYSQGGWATLAVHNAIETKYKDDFTLKASMCGAGVYDIWAVNQLVVTLPLYPQPYFIAYLVAAQKSLDSFTNPISDIFKAPYAERVPGLFNGKLSGDEINAQLTVSVPDLFTDEYRTNLNDAKFSTIKAALQTNSVAPWKTSVPVRFVHGAADTSVPFTSSQLMSQAMQAAGTPADKIQLVPLPGLDHGDAIVPASLNGFLWFFQLK